VIGHVEAVAPEIPVPSYIMARHMRLPLSLQSKWPRLKWQRVLTHTRDDQNASALPIGETNLKQDNNKILTSL